ncbi:MAG: heavy-metal-associated domain-containing protein [Ruminococcus sp.]|nr:heavy-metal-associated domain-containing protein [Ruminococcus sp.]
MKKTYAMEDLDCAVCAAKMEDAISKLEGVHSVSISYVLQQITIDAQEDKLPQIMKQAQKVCKRVERNCRIIL